MSKQVKTIAGCLLPNGERLGLRRVEDRVGAALLSSHLELHKGDQLLATDPADIEFGLRFMPLSDDDRCWMLQNLRAAIH